MIGLFHIYIFLNIERNFTEYVHIDRDNIIDRYEIIIKHLNIYVF